jgi:hypothetical protein
MEGYRPAVHPVPRFMGSAGGRKKARCDELVARKPDVILELSDTPQDYTHLQKCGAPVKKDGKCARHLAQANTNLDYQWRRFLGRQ